MPLPIAIQLLTLLPNRSRGLRLKTDFEHTDITACLVRLVKKELATKHYLPVGRSKFEYRITAKGAELLSNYGQTVTITGRTVP